MPNSSQELPKVKRRASNSKTRVKKVSPLPQLRPGPKRMSVGINKTEFGKSAGSNFLPPKNTTAQRSYRGEDKESSAVRMSNTHSNMKSIVATKKTRTVMNRRNNSQNGRIPDLPPKTRYSNLMNTSMSSNQEKKFMRTEA